MATFPIELQERSHPPRRRESLVQGTGIPWSIRERMQKLMDEIRQREDVILFIDEIHEVVGTGSAGEAIWTLEISSNQPWRAENSN